MKDNKQQTYIWFPTFFSILFIVGVLVGTQLDNNAPMIQAYSSSNKHFSGIGQGKIEELIRYVDAKYVDDVSRQRLMEEAIQSIIQELDPHSSYISAEELQRVNEQLEGSFDGIGVEFMIFDDTLTIVGVLAGGPSEKTGLKVGDKIISVNDTIVAGQNKSLNSIVDQLKGEKGSTVTVSILRNKEKNQRKFVIRRDAIPINSIDVAYAMENGIGYIKINRFSASTHEEFMKHLEELVEKEGVKDLIIDLRHNPGGYLQQATMLLSQLFKEKGKLLVYTEGRTVKRTDYKTSGRNFFSIDKVAVLIDEGSASASEIVAGAIQDLDRGVIVGRRSFGKGLVQEQYNLNDGSALRLTVARYYTPSGRSIQRPYNDFKEYDADITQRYQNGELEDVNNIITNDSLKFRTSKGRVVYGGGGIVPDIFVPLDTSFYNETYNGLRNYTPQFIFKFAESHKLPERLEDIIISEDMIDEYLNYCATKKVPLDKLSTSTLREKAKRLLETRIANQIKGNTGYYQIWNKGDVVVQKAIEALQASDPLKLRALK
jgi:carboxyl-terminal processing protease